MRASWRALAIACLGALTLTAVAQQPPEAPRVAKPRNFQLAQGTLTWRYLSPDIASLSYVPRGQAGAAPTVVIDPALDDQVLAGCPDRRPAGRGDRQPLPILSAFLRDQPPEVPVRPS